MIFTLVIAAAFMVPLAFLARNTLRRILYRQNRAQLVLFVATFVAGVGAGWWLGFKFTYYAHSELQILGCPLPLVAFQLEGDRWVDFVMPIPLMNASLNLIIITLLAVAPLNIVSRFPRARANPAGKNESEQAESTVPSKAARSAASDVR